MHHNWNIVLDPIGRFSVNANYCFIVKKLNVANMLQHPSSYTSCGSRGYRQALYEPIHHGCIRRAGYGPACGPKSINPIDHHYITVDRSLTRTASDVNDYSLNNEFIIREGFIFVQNSQSPPKSTAWELHNVETNPP